MPEMHGQPEANIVSFCYSYAFLRKCLCCWESFAYLMVLGDNIA